MSGTKRTEGFHAVFLISFGFVMCCLCLNSFGYVVTYPVLIYTGMIHTLSLIRYTFPRSVACGRFHAAATTQVLLSCHVLASVLLLLMVVQCVLMCA